MTAALILVVLVSLPFIAILVRRPVLRRLALRNAVRRPREAALVVLGSLLGAAIITGSAVVGDTMNASIRQVARTHLGPIDELVSVRSPAEQAQLLRVLQPLESGDVDGVLAFATMEAAVTSTGPRVLTVPRSQLLSVDFENARAFGRDAEATGIIGSTPDVGHAAITADVARALDITAGGRIALHAYGIRTTLVVDRVLPRRGVAGFWLGAEQEARNVLVSPKTFDFIRAGGEGGTPPIWRVAVSNRGGVEDGALLTDDVSAQIRAAGAAAKLTPRSTR